MSGMTINPWGEPLPPNLPNPGPNAATPTTALTLVASQPGDQVARIQPLTVTQLRSLSALVSRLDFARRAGKTHGGNRDLYTALGYPRSLGIEDIRDEHRRGGIAKRLLEIYPKAAWAGGAAIVENPDPGEETVFETAVDSLFRRLKIWSRLTRADILSQFGHYSILLIGAPGAANTPLPSSLSPDDIYYLKPYAEDHAEIADLVSDPANPRFGLPTAYNIKIVAPSLSHAGASSTIVHTIREVHWSRVIHISTDLLEDDVYSPFGLESVWNYLLDLQKVVGGGSEAAWKRMDPGLHVDLDPDVEYTSETEEALEDQVDEYLHNVSRIIRTRGGKVNPLAAAVNAFGPNAAFVINLIASTRGIPVRILMGSERGEQASTQDRKNWADRIAEYRATVCEQIISDIVDRFVTHGALPAPENENWVQVWPSIEELDELEKSQAALNKAQANIYQYRSEQRIIYPANEIRAQIDGLGPTEAVVIAPPDPAGPTVGGPVGGTGERLDNTPGGSEVSFSVNALRRLKSMLRISGR